MIVLAMEDTSVGNQPPRKNRPQNMHCDTQYVGCGSILLEPDLAINMEVLMSLSYACNALSSLSQQDCFPQKSKTQ